MSTVEVNAKERARFHRQVVARYRKLKNVKEVADHYELAETTVRNICRDAGIVFRASPEERKLANTIRVAMALIRGGKKDKVAEKSKFEPWEVEVIANEIEACGLVEMIEDLKEQSGGMNAMDYEIMAHLIDGRAAASIARETGHPKKDVNRVRVAFRDSDLWQRIQMKRKRQSPPREMKASTYDIIREILAGSKNVDIAEKLDVDQKFVSKVRGLCRDHGLIE